MISFRINCDGIGSSFLFSDSFEVEQGTSWAQFLSENKPCIKEDSVYYWGYDEENNWFGIIHSFSTTASVDYCYQLKTASGENVEKDMPIKAGDYILEDGLIIVWDPDIMEGAIPLK